MMGEDMIPCDDILDTYVNADLNVRQVVSDLLSNSGSAILASVMLGEGTDVGLTAYCNGENSLIMISTMIKYMMQRYGEAWLEQLKKNY